MAVESMNTISTGTRALVCHAYIETSFRQALVATVTQLVVRKQ